MNVLKDYFVLPNQNSIILLNFFYYKIFKNKNFFELILCLDKFVFLNK